MKKIILAALFLMALQTGLFAQPPGLGPRGDVQAIKIAFMTRQLSLTAEEAQKFWPVYNIYFDEMTKAHKEQKDDELLFEETALNIRKKYKEEFKKVLNSDERANKVLKADREFNNMVRKELQKRSNKMKEQPKNKIRQQRNPSSDE